MNTIFPPIVLFIILFILALKFSKDDESITHLKHGRASKIEYEGHSYIVWQQNITDCIIHDPDCRCIKKEAQK